MSDFNIAGLLGQVGGALSAHATGGPQGLQQFLAIQARRAEQAVSQDFAREQTSKQSAQKIRSDLFAAKEAEKQRQHESGLAAQRQSFARGERIAGERYTTGRDTIASGRRDDDREDRQKAAIETASTLNTWAEAAARDALAGRRADATTLEGRRIVAANVATGRAKDTADAVAVLQKQLKKMGFKASEAQALTLLQGQQGMAKTAEGNQVTRDKLAAKNRKEEIALNAKAVVDAAELAHKNKSDAVEDAQLHDHALLNKRIEAEKKAKAEIEQERIESAKTHIKTMIPTATGGKNFYRWAKDNGYTLRDGADVPIEKFLNPHHTDTVGKASLAAAIHKLAEDDHYPLTLKQIQIDRSINVAGWEEVFGPGSAKGAIITDDALTAAQVKNNSVSNSVLKLTNDALLVKKTLEEIALTGDFDKGTEVIDTQAAKLGEIRNKLALLTRTAPEFFAPGNKNAVTRDVLNTQIEAHMNALEFSRTALGKNAVTIAWDSDRPFSRSEDNPIFHQSGGGSPNNEVTDGIHGHGKNTKAFKQQETKFNGLVSILRNLSGLTQDELEEIGVGNFPIADLLTLVEERGGSFTNIVESFRNTADASQLDDAGKTGWDWEQNAKLMNRALSFDVKTLTAGVTRLNEQNAQEQNAVSLNDNVRNAAGVYLFPPGTEEEFLKQFSNSKPTSIGYGRDIVNLDKEGQAYEDVVANYLADEKRAIAFVSQFPFHSMGMADTVFGPPTLGTWGDQANQKIDSFARQMNLSTDTVENLRRAVAKHSGEGATIVTDKLDELFTTDIPDVSRRIESARETDSTKSQPIDNDPRLEAAVSAKIFPGLELTKFTWPNIAKMSTGSSPETRVATGNYGFGKGRQLFAPEIGQLPVGEGSTVTIGDISGWIMDVSPAVKAFVERSLLHQSSYENPMGILSKSNRSGTGLSSYPGEFITDSGFGAGSFMAHEAVKKRIPFSSELDRNNPHWTSINSARIGWKNARALRAHNTAIQDDSNYDSSAPATITRGSAKAGAQGDELRKRMILDIFNGFNFDSAPGMAQSAKRQGKRLQQVLRSYTVEEATSLLLGPGARGIPLSKFTGEPEVARAGVASTELASIEGRYDLSDTKLREVDASLSRDLLDINAMAMSAQVIDVASGKDVTFGIIDDARKIQSLNIITEKKKELSAVMSARPYAKRMEKKLMRQLVSTTAIALKNGKGNLGQMLFEEKFSNLLSNISTPDLKGIDEKTTATTANLRTSIRSILSDDGEDLSIDSYAKLLGYLGEWEVKAPAADYGLAGDMLQASMNKHGSRLKVIHNILVNEGVDDNPAEYYSALNSGIQAGMTLKRWQGLSTVDKALAIFVLEEDNK